MILQNQLLHYFDTQLQQLAQEIEAYSDESLLWVTPTGISNSGGNLCTHLLGNLNHYIGHILGNTDYVRNRPLEFSIKNVPVAELLEQIRQTREMLQTVLPALTDLHQDYPSEEISKSGSIQFILIRLLGHLNYHLGQVNYHRRFCEA